MGDNESINNGGLNTFCDVFDNYKLTDVQLPNLKQDTMFVDYMSSFDELTRKQKLISMDDILKITKGSVVQDLSDNISVQQRNPAYAYKDNNDIWRFDIETEGIDGTPAPITEPTFHVTSNKKVKLFYNK